MACQMRLKSQFQVFQSNIIYMYVLPASVLLILKYPDWSREVAQLCIDYQGEGVVGIDLAGDESFGEISATRDHIWAFEV